MTTQLYADPTFKKVLNDEVKEKNCEVCVHRAQRIHCVNGYLGYYHCRNENNGFELDENK